MNNPHHSFWLALLGGSLMISAPSSAQTFTDVTATNSIKGGTTATPGTFEWRSGGALISTGSLNQGSLLSSDFQNRPMMVWDSARSAFFAGFGSTGRTLGFYSASFGRGRATGPDSFATGSGLATGSHSAAFGYLSTAAGYFSLASGGLSVATGAGASSFGGSSLAAGDFSAAFGDTTRANAYASFVIGRYNIGIATEEYDDGNGYTTPNGAVEWVETDAIFEIGNGTPGYTYPDWDNEGIEYEVIVPPTLSNAMTVYKNGNAEISGTLKVQGRYVVTNSSTFGSSFSGKVGIGITNPARALDIYVPNTAATNYALRISNGTNLAYDIGRNGSDGFLHFAGVFGPGGYVFSAGGAEKMRIAANGNVGIGGVTTPQARLEVANGTIRSSGGNAGLEFIDRSTGRPWQWYGSGDSARLRDGATDRLSVTAEGKVGIGTATPQHALEVVGDVKVTGVIRVTTPAGDIPMFQP